MANDKKKKDSLSKQVKNIKRRYSSEDESEINVSAKKLNTTKNNLERASTNGPSTSKGTARPSFSRGFSHGPSKEDLQLKKFVKASNNEEESEVEEEEVCEEEHVQEEEEDEMEEIVNILNNGLPPTEEEEAYQLFGQSYSGDIMIPIGNDIFCRRTIMDMAMGSSHKPTHLARKLIEGVFTKETLLSSTLTGLPPRAQGKERQNAMVKMLNLRARNAIVNFSITIGGKKGWSVQNRQQIERAMSQRLGELKRSSKKNTI